MYIWCRWTNWLAISKNGYKNGTERNIQQKSYLLNRTWVVTAVTGVFEESSSAFIILVLLREERRK